MNPSSSIIARDTMILQKYLAIVLKDLSELWTPHAGQVQVGIAHFTKGLKKIFVRCGRKFGKTEIACYILYRLALSKPNQHLYYIAPTYKQAKELIWENGRLPNFLGRFKGKYVEKISESEHRITFKNGSFIKIDGSENYEAYRGINPHGIVYDEYKDFHVKFHEGMEPNLATYQAPIFIFGTPPDTEDHPFVRTEIGIQKDKSGAYFKMPTATNPYIDKAWLEQMKETLIARGEWHVWMREYEAEIVPSGALHIFPMLECPKIGPDGKLDGHTKHVRPYQEIHEKILRHPKDFTYHAVFDPASTSCFGALFCVVHKQSKKVSVLKEIYEKNKDRTSAKQIWPLSKQIKRTIIPSESWMSQWRDVYDYAAAWFANEIKDEYHESMIPCVKDLKDKEVKLSSIKDFIKEGLFEISDQCPNLIWEMRNYATDENGKIPKKNDHLIDCTRYLFNDAHLHTIPKTKFKHEDPEMIRVMPEDGFPEFEEELPFDPYSELTEEFYE